MRVRLGAYLRVEHKESAPLVWCPAFLANARQGKKGLAG